MFKIILILYSVAIQLHAVENRLVCSDCSLFLSDCSLKTGALSRDSSFERKFEIKVDFNCRGHETNIGFRTDNGFHVIKTAKNQQEIKLSGKKLLLVDDAPGKTQTATFDLGCELKIAEIAETLSAASQRLLDDYDAELSRLSDTLADLKSIDDQIIELMVAIEQVNPEHLDWAVKTLKKIAAKLSLLVNNPIFASKDPEVLALKEAVVQTKEVLRSNLVGRVKAIFDRMDAILFESMDMAAFTGSRKFEEKVMQAKDNFRGL